VTTSGSGTRRGRWPGVAPNAADPGSAPPAGWAEEIRDQKLAGEAKLEKRIEESKPLVAELFEWLEQELVASALVPTNPFTNAARHALKLKPCLEVFLSDPEVPIDTNHLERALRPIPMGRKAWLFCWTEVGAEKVVIIQSLISTCVIQGVDPYTYLVDVLQRGAEHPQSEVADLTPRIWKEKFAQRAIPSPALADSISGCVKGRRSLTGYISIAKQLRHKVPNSASCPGIQASASERDTPEPRREARVPDGTSGGQRQVILTEFIEFIRTR